MMMMKNFIKLFLVLVVVLSICSGCTLFGKKEKTKWRPVKQKKQVFIHIVRWEDESYEMIAKWYTGKKQNVEPIINANPTLNPEKLYVGDKVYIPKKILHTRKSFSRIYIEDYNKKSVKKVKKKYIPPVTKPAKKNEDFQLFGPR